MAQPVVQIYKNTGSNRAPAIHLPPQLPTPNLANPQLLEAAQMLFQSDGVLVLHQLFNPAFITRLYEAFTAQYQAYFQARPDRDALMVGHKRKMLTLNFRAPFNDPELYANRFLMGVLRGVLGDGFVLGSFGAVIALPGAEHPAYPS